MAVDRYCERVEPGLLGEPLNAVTNLAILFVAWMAWREAQRSTAPDRGIGLLIALLASFGFGSGLFHSFANSLTRWLDVLPIAAFIATYLWLYLRRVAGIRPAAAWLAVAAFVVAAIVARQFPGILNGSLPMLQPGARPGWACSTGCQRGLKPNAPRCGRRLRGGLALPTMPFARPSRSARISCGMCAPPVPFTSRCGR